MTSKQFTILIADDDDGHAYLVEDSLRRSGVTVPLIRFQDGQEVLDFLFGRTVEPLFDPAQKYLLLLDIRMPKVDGVEVLQRLKRDSKLRKLPVILLTTTEDPREVIKCHEIGCNAYIQKPVSWEKFAAAINKLGDFITMVQIPTVATPP